MLNAALLESPERPEPLLKTVGTGSPTAPNLIIKGENRRVLGQLNEHLRGRVRCVYIDPPYNNQETYNHYQDGDDHAVWLDKLKLRLSLLFETLTEDGSIWVSIDDREAHYLKVACDELFGRDKFVSTIIWNHRKSRENRRVFSFNHEYLLVYARQPQVFADARNELPLTKEVLKRYKNPDCDPRGPWQSVSANVQAGHATSSQFYEIIAPNGKKHRPPDGRCWVYGKARMEHEIASGNVWFGQDGNGVPRLKKFLRHLDRGLTPSTLWPAEEVGTTREAKKQVLSLFPDQRPFDTPKPEQLIRRVLHIATNPGELVLDAYLGSGTTAAVAHKMGRRYIGIEVGEHAVTLCAKRLEAVVEGEQSGISQDVQWRGGGGFSLIELR